MDLRIFYALILSVLPLVELRGGLPLGIIYALEHDIPVLLVFATIILMNILAIFIAFYFLDHVHVALMKVGFYERFFNSYIEKTRRRIDKFEKHYESVGFFALVLFVGIPLPGTGAWSGCLVSWILGLNRKMSAIAISIGVLIAGIIILLGTLGVINAFS